MIKLTTRNGDNVFLAVEQIISITGGDKANVFTSEDCYNVIESPEEVARKVLEYRLAMITFAHGSEGELSSAYHRLRELSGLSAEKGADK